MPSLFLTTNPYTALSLCVSLCVCVSLSTPLPFPPSPSAAIMRFIGKRYNAIPPTERVASSATLYPDSSDGIDADMSAALIDSIVDQEADVSVCRQKQRTTTHVPLKCERMQLVTLYTPSTCAMLAFPPCHTHTRCSEVRSCSTRPR